MTTKYTYTHKFQAHYATGIVIVPDQVADDQRGWARDGNKSFPALRASGSRDKVRVRLDPEAYDLFGTGTGDMIVKSV